MTPGQFEVMKDAAVNPLGRGIFKNDYKPGRSRLWRNIDQCEAHGWLELRTMGRYIITDAGRAALAATAR